MTGAARFWGHPLSVGTTGSLSSTVEVVADIAAVVDAGALVVQALGGSDMGMC